ncbi:hypothetical protein GN244_ATG00431 [Phytophthora infestans]|uniref:Uncharacterized protein n=1 Tax=Phytophthora infestans TaxID=4787 RepID=A0A833T4C1_PHYIN|nr:hypothetical protein GN244_ATG00431 [Phytophthora infestans]
MGWCSGSRSIQFRDNWIGMPNPKYYVLLQYSRSDDSTNTVVAFDGSTKLVTANSGDSATTVVQLQRGQQSREPRVHCISLPKTIDREHLSLLHVPPLHTVKHKKIAISQSNYSYKLTHNHFSEKFS